MTPLEDIRGTFKAMLRLPDSDLWAVDLAIATTLAAKSPRDWEHPYAAIVGPPSTGKTEILRPFMSWPGVSVNYSDQTANAFSSGSFSVTTSLLHRLERRVLILPDMTGILEGSKTTKDIFFSTLRLAVDGTHDKHSGATDQPNAIKVNFTTLAAVTEAVYPSMERDKDMGQRFLFFRMFRGLSRAVRRTISKNIMRGDFDNPRWRDNAREAVHAAMLRLRDHYSHETDMSLFRRRDGEGEKEYASRMRMFKEEETAGWHRICWPTVTIPEHMQDVLFALGEILTFVRSGKTDIQMLSGAAEGNARVMKQLRVLASMRALSDFRLEMSPMDLAFAGVLVRDTLTPFRLSLVRHLFRASHTDDGGLTSPNLARAVGYSGDDIDNILTHYAKLGFVTRFKRPTGAEVYRLSDWALEDYTLCAPLLTD